MGTVSYCNILKGIQCMALPDTERFLGWMKWKVLEHFRYFVDITNHAFTSLSWACLFTELLLGDARLTKPSAILTQSTFKFLLLTTHWDLALFPTLSEQGWSGGSREVTSVISPLFALMETRQFLCPKGHSTVSQLTSYVSSEIAHRRRTSRCTRRQFSYPTIWIQPRLPPKGVWTWPWQLGNIPSLWWKHSLSANNISASCTFAWNLFIVECRNSCTKPAVIGIIIPSLLFGLFQ